MTKKRITINLGNIKRINRLIMRNGRYGAYYPNCSYKYDYNEDNIKNALKAVSSSFIEK